MLKKIIAKLLPDCLKPTTERESVFAGVLVFSWVLIAIFILYSWLEDLCAIGNFDKTETKETIKTKTEIHYKPMETVRHVVKLDTITIYKRDTVKLRDTAGIYYSVPDFLAQDSVIFNTRDTLKVAFYSDLARRNGIFEYNFYPKPDSVKTIEKIITSVQSQLPKQQPKNTVLEVVKMGVVGLAGFGIGKLL